jgi:hypothetical protein
MTQFCAQQVIIGRSVTAPAAIPKTVGTAPPRGYDVSMETRPRRKLAPVWRALVEIGFIVFLFYSNLLMGEFSRSAGKGKSLAFALHDMVTATNLTIGLCSALVGYLVFEFLRRRF